MPITAIATIESISAVRLKIGLPEKTEKISATAAKAKISTSM